MLRDTWQFRNVIFLQPQCLRPWNLAGWVNRLMGRHAHSQMTLLFHGHVTKMLYFHFHMAYGLWHWLRRRKHHLKICNSRDTFTNWQIENLMPNFFSKIWSKLFFYFSNLYLPSSQAKLFISPCISFFNFCKSFVV